MKIIAHKKYCAELFVRKHKSVFEKILYAHLLNGFSLSLKRHQLFKKNLKQFNLSLQKRD